jgi:hypothetical protein
VTRDLRPSVRATYDSRESGRRYWVTTEIGDRTVTFREPVDDPFVRTRVRVGWVDLVRGLVRGHLTVTVAVGGDRHIVDDVLELDENTLVKGRTREAAFRQSIHEKLGCVGG